MDEILLANFTVLQDAVDSGDYDLVAADEAGTSTTSGTRTPKA